MTRAAVIYVEAQYDQADGVVRLTAQRAEHSGSFSVTVRAATLEQATAEANKFAAMYRDLGLEVRT